MLNDQQIKEASRELASFVSDDNIDVDFMTWDVLIPTAAMVKNIIEEDVNKHATIELIDYILGFEESVWNSDVRGAFESLIRMVWDYKNKWING